MTLIGQIKADKSKNLRSKIRKNSLHPRYPRSIFGTAAYVSGWPSSSGMTWAARRSL
jgi:hypothetical protein